MKQNDMPICNEIKDCFAKTTGGECKILTSTYPQGKCPFWKPIDKPLSQEIRQIVDKRITLTATHNTEKQCEFYVGSEERYCKCCTNTRCKGCHFYSPNLATKMKMMAESLIDLEKSRDEIRGNLQTSERKANRLAEVVEEVNIYKDRVLPYVQIGKCLIRHRKKMKGTC